MTGPTYVDTVALRDEFNLGYTLLRRFPSGLQGGAWHLVDAGGREAVLKCGSPPDVGQLAVAIGRVRAAGYPAPAWLAHGVSALGRPYYVQEFVAGESATPLTAATVPLLTRVLQRQAGLDPMREVGWEARISTMAFGPELRSIVSGLGVAGSQLVARFDALLTDVTLPSGDMVHGDFNTCNVLLSDGSVSGVIDVDGLGRGTRVFDYACLLREAYVEGYGDELTRMLHSAALAIAGPEVLRVCVAATAFDCVRFKLSHEPHRMPEILERLTRLSMIM